MPKIYRSASDSETGGPSWLDLPTQIANPSS
jgi:hypothetical protein